MKATKIKVLIGVIVFYIITVTILAQVTNERLARERADVSQGMDRLQQIADEMIKTKAAGVVTEGSGSPFIESFPAFFQFIEKNHPEALPTLEGNNPFPGILPGTDYSKLDGMARSKYESLISSHWIHYKTGDQRFVLLCSGEITIKARPGTGTGPIMRESKDVNSN